ncbi:AAA family ATPase [Occultella gossypii]|uniref:AAA family ATPase n=1 Tax=Occultella gossypii TaxID=2800820 RepID=A0ABS7S6J4_9MICO|nr:AAA family ATPase [Occultella gossypii]MBZ2195976.1 AAA family ATPase [Occultella gossypii]
MKPKDGSGRPGSHRDGTPGRPAGTAETSFPQDGAEEAVYQLGYADVADLYTALDWAPVPLLDAGKGRTPIGATGYVPAIPGEQVEAWSRRYPRNGVCVRLQGVVGLDVDAYGDKAGAETLAALEAEYGELPATVRVTSRADAPDYDGTSGIRLYRLPAALAALERKRVWLSGPGEGIETVRWGHRQANVWPTRHPRTGRIYGYLDERTGAVVHGPLSDPKELPELPEAWGRALLKPGASAGEPDAVSAVRTQVPPEWLSDGEPCPPVERALDESLAMLDGDGRHDKVLPATQRLLRLGEQGHRGAAAALDELHARFVEAIQDRASETEAEAEWERQYEGAAGRIEADGRTPEADRGCCAERGAPGEDFDVVASVGATPEDTFARKVAAEADLIRIREAARELVHRERAGPLPPFDSGTLAELLARPPAPPYRVESLIPADGSVLLTAQRKTGKTTFALNLARSLITGDDFLDRFETRAIDGNVAVLNFEVSGHSFARWAAEVGIPDERMFIVNLRGRRNPFTAPEDRAELARVLRDHDVESLIVDPFGRAYSGVQQNDAGEVGGWLTALDEFTRAEVGATDLVLAAHAGWDGERTRGSSALEDWADAIITLTRSADPDDPLKYMRAVGRDVDVDEDALAFNPLTRELSLTGNGSRRSAKDQRVREQILAVLAEHPDGLSGAGLEGEGVPKTKDARAVRDSLVKAGAVRQEPRSGKGGGFTYRLSSAADEFGAS